MSVLPTLILVMLMLFVKILRAHTSVRVRRDIQGIETHVMVSQKMKEKMPVTGRFVWFLFSKLF